MNWPKIHKTDEEIYEVICKSAYFQSFMIYGKITEFTTSKDKFFYFTLNDKYRFFGNSDYVDCIKLNDYIIFTAFNKYHQQMLNLQVVELNFNSSTRKIIQMWHYSQSDNPYTPEGNRAFKIFDDFGAVVQDGRWNSTNCAWIE